MFLKTSKVQIGLFMAFTHIYLMSHTASMYDYYLKYLFHASSFNLLDLENTPAKKGKISLGWV